jgi:moderate conductance mechanosensitive channel
MDVNDIPPISMALVLAVLISLGGRWGGRAARRRLEDASTAPETISLQRRATVTRAVSSTITVLVWSVALLLILARLEVNVAAVLTTAGVAGLIIAFGAQSFVRDVTAGVFVIFENQYDVGDRIELRVGDRTLEGWVLSVRFRSTDLELDDGTTAFVEHGQVVYAINRSRGHGTAAVTVSIPQEIEPQDVRDAIERTVGEVDDEPRLRRMVFGGPRIEQGENADGTTLAVRLETRPERTTEVERKIRDRIARAVEPISPEIRVDEAA